MPAPGEGNETKLDPQETLPAAPAARREGGAAGAETEIATPPSGHGDDPGATVIVEGARGEEETDRTRLPRYGDFRVVSELGSGAMGIVYRAQQLVNEQPSRTVALKVLKPELSHEPSFEERFFREALHALNLRHPNLVHGIHAKKENDVCYMAMEFVDGETLSDRVERDGPLDVGDALRIVRDVASGLQHAHENGVFHRDVKPGNVMVSRKGEVKVTDLGLAKSPAHDLGLTVHGQLVGTPIYMAPEQLDQPDEPDARYDIYALGGTLFYLLTGRVPFRGDSMRELRSQKQRPRPPAARAFRPDLPAAAGTLLARMLDPDPRQRPESMAEVIAAIDSTGLANEALSWAPNAAARNRGKDRGFLARNWKKLAVAVGGVGAVVGLLLSWPRPEPLPPPQKTPVVAQATPALPASAFIAAAIESLAEGRSAAAYDALHRGLQAHPEDEAMKRLSVETRDGVVELFQYRDPDGHVSAPLFPHLSGPILLEPGSKFRPGVLLSQKCHVYVLYADPAGNVEWLFFGGLMSPNLHWIRSPRDEFFARDSLSGESKFYVIAVTRPLVDPDNVVRPLVAENPDLLRHRLEADPGSLLEEPRGADDVPGRSCFATQPLAVFSVVNR